MYENWALGELSAGEKDEVQANYEKSLIDTLEKKQSMSSLHLSVPLFVVRISRMASFHLADVLPTFSEGLQALVDVRFFAFYALLMMRTLGFLHQVLQLAQIRELELERLLVSRLAPGSHGPVLRSLPTPPIVPHGWHHIRLLAVPCCQHPRSWPRSS